MVVNEFDKWLWYWSNLEYEYEFEYEYYYYLSWEWIIILSFITGGEDGYVRLCFFDAEYFTKDEMEEKELRQLELLAEKKA